MDLSSLLHPSPLIPSLRLQPPISRRHVSLLPPLTRRHVTSHRHVTSSSKSSIFGPDKELTGIQPLISNLTPPVRLASSVALALAAIAAGYGLGFRIEGSKKGAIAGGAAFGVAGCAMVYKLNSEVPQVAAVSLHNLVAGRDDPLELRQEEIEALAQRYGVSKQDEAFRAELSELYYRFVYNLLPPGGEDLKGNEIETLTKFKSALGIDDIDAANVHMEIGRRIFRERLETGDRDSDAAQRLAFQKLIYVSNLVFGEASTFLLPWKRLFKVTDAQVKIAIRENAKKLYGIKLSSIGRDIEPNQLIELRKSQLLFTLSDEIASEMFREHSRKLIEENVKAALDILKSRSKSATGMPQAIEEIKTILAFNELLTSLKNHPEASQFPPGVQPVSLLGGEFDVERNSSNLKLLYRTYASESFPDGRLDEKMLEGLKKLRNILGLGKKETETIMLDIKSTMYKKRLSKAFNTDLASAPSKALFLQNLCEDLHFDPENASKLHEEIYRQKLQQFVADNELSDDDVETLTSYQVRLCIPQETVDKIHSEICGKLFAKVVDSAVLSGVNGSEGDMRSAIRKAAHGLRLSKDEALAITSKAVRKAFIEYVRNARAATNKVDTAKELQKLVQFNISAITPLVADIKGEPIVETEIESEPETEPKPDLDEDEDEDEEMKSLKELKPNVEKFKGKRIAPASQKEINLREDLTYLERADLYETYWHHSTTGGSEDGQMPFGLTVPTKANKSAERQRLDQLGEILGLTEAETVKIATNIAEKAFIKEAESILADGQLTKARIEQLSRLQSDLSLPDSNAQKVIKNITRNKMASSISLAVSRGKMGISEVRELKSAGVTLSDVIEESLREVILKRAVEDVFASGKGEFDAAEVLERIPEDVGVGRERARKVVEEFAKGRRGSALVDGVAMLRQKNPDGVVGALNDMLACDMAVPADSPLTWSKPAELEELYRIYLKSIPKPDKLARLQFLLGITDERAFAIQDAAQEGAVVSKEGVEEQEQEEEEFVF